MEYFHGAHSHFLMPATEVQETVMLVLSLEFLACLKLGMNTQFVLGFLKTYKGLLNI